MKNYLILLLILILSLGQALSQKALTAHDFAQLKTREEHLDFFHRKNLPNIPKPAFDSIKRKKLSICYTIGTIMRPLIIYTKKFAKERVKNKC